MIAGVLKIENDTNMGANQTKVTGTTHKTPLEQINEQHRSDATRRFRRRFANARTGMEREGQSM